jgi:hypothetical protein
VAANVEWLNSNSNRSYPFAEDASRKDSTGSVELPNNFLVDLVFVVPADVGELFYVNSIQFSSSSLTVGISAIGGTAAGAITIDVDAHIENAGYDIVGALDFEDARGRAVFGDLSNLRTTVPEGNYTFGSSSGKLEARTVRPDLRSLRFFRIQNPDGSISEAINGIVRLVPGNNIQITLEPEEITTVLDPVTGDPVEIVSTPAGIRIDAISDPDFVEECECESSFPKPDPIRMINGVTGDEDGELTMSGESCIVFSTGGESTVAVDDSCSQPCCGCPELEFITQNLILLEDSIDKLVARAEELATRQQNFYNDVLASLM